MKILALDLGKFKLHLSTWGVVLFVGAGLVLIIVPGELVSAGGGIGHSSLGGTIGGGWEDYEHGWPRVHLRRTVGFADWPSFSQDEPIPWTRKNSWSHQGDDEEWDLGAIAVNMLAASVVLVLVGGPFEIWMRRRLQVRHFRRLEWAAIGLVVLAVLCWAGFHVKTYGQERDAAAKLGEFSGFDWSYRGPIWLKKLVGHRAVHMLDVVVGVDLVDDLTDEGIGRVVRRLKSLSSLERVNIESEKATDHCVTHLAELTQIRSLQLSYCQISDEGLRQISRMKNLRELTLIDPKITDEGLVHLRGLQLLTSLSIGGSEITGSGLARLAELPHLSELELWSIPIGDDVFEHLRDVTSLRDLRLEEVRLSDKSIDGIVQLKHLRTLEILSSYDPGISRRGVERLKRALPSVEIDIQ